MVLFSLVRRYDFKHVWELIIFTMFCFRSYYCGALHRKMGGYSVTAIHVGWHILVCCHLSYIQASVTAVLLLTQGQKQTLKWFSRVITARFTGGCKGVELTAKETKFPDATAQRDRSQAPGRGHTSLKSIGNTGETKSPRQNHHMS